MIRNTYKTNTTYTYIYIYSIYIYIWVENNGKHVKWNFRALSTIPPSAVRLTLSAGTCSPTRSWATPWSAITSWCSRFWTWSPPLTRGSRCSRFMMIATLAVVTCTILRPMMIYSTGNPLTEAHLNGHAKPWRSCIIVTRHMLWSRHNGKKDHNHIYVRLNPNDLLFWEVDPAITKMFGSL